MSILYLAFNVRVLNIQITIGNGESLHILLFNIQKNLENREIVRIRLHLDLTFLLVYVQLCSL